MIERKSAALSGRARQIDLIALLCYYFFMLFEARRLDGDYIDAYRISPEGFQAALIGNIALLGQKYEGSKTLEAYDGSIADLLLSSPSTAVMHFEKPEDDAWRGWSIMMAVNYHDGHSEGHHKIVVQDPSKIEDGQWELWIPPESNNRKFYRRKLYDDKPYPFEKSPANPGKIRDFYVHFGDSGSALDDFKDAGFEFSEESPGDWLFDRTSEAYRLNVLSGNNRERLGSFRREIIPDFQSYGPPS